MIKSKIDARERALELAVKSFNLAYEFSAQSVIAFSEMYEKYLIGDAELPEVFDNNADLKELFEVAKREMEKIYKRNDDSFADLIKSLPEDVIRDKGLVGIVPCKSDIE